VIITSSKLIAAQVDKGTLAYVLSTPIKRSTVALTQTVFFLGSLFLMFAISAGAHILSTALSAGSISSADVITILQLNLGLFVLNMAFSGICFLASCIFNLSKHAIAVSGGIVGAFLLMSIMAMFGSNFGWMQNFTIVSLYDIHSVFAGEPDFIWKFVVLAVIGAVTYAIGSVIFDKRDLPL
jgi:ABC-2 type transport system permease protein